MFRTFMGEFIVRLSVECAYVVNHDAFEKVMDHFRSDLEWLERNYWQLYHMSIGLTHILKESVMVMNSSMAKFF